MDLTLEILKLHILVKELQASREQLEIQNDAMQLSREDSAEIKHWAILQVRRRFPESSNYDWQDIHV